MQFSSITINNSSFSGKNVSIVNGVVTIDGQVQKMPDEKIITISVVGNLESLHIGSCKELIITGDVERVDTQSGGVKCNNVKGNIKTLSGSVSCGDVTGDVETMSGNVNAQDIIGRVKTISGNIRGKNN
jgi:predicted RNA-binding protein